VGVREMGKGSMRVGVGMRMGIVGVGVCGRWVCVCGRSGCVWEIGVCVCGRSEVCVWEMRGRCVEDAGGVREMGKGSMRVGVGMRMGMGMGNMGVGECGRVWEMGVGVWGMGVWVWEMGVGVWEMWVCVCGRWGCVCGRWEVCVWEMGVGVCVTSQRLVLLDLSVFGYLAF
jgi:hypothetical protein